MSNLDKPKRNSGSRYRKGKHEWHKAGDERDVELRDSIEIAISSPSLSW
jgi:hypothetical protein